MPGMLVLAIISNTLPNWAELVLATTASVALVLTAIAACNTWKQLTVARTAARDAKAAADAQLDELSATRIEARRPFPHLVVTRIGYVGDDFGIEIEIVNHGPGVARDVWFDFWFESFDFEQVEREPRVLRNAADQLMNGRPPDAHRALGVVGTQPFKDRFPLPAKFAWEPSSCLSGEFKAWDHMLITYRASYTDVAGEQYEHFEPVLARRDR